MFVTFDKDDGSVPEIWEFDPNKVRASQAEMVEKRYGQPWDVFLRDLIKGSMLARRVLLWHLTRLSHHTLRFEDTPDFYAAKITALRGNPPLTLYRRDNRGWLDSIAMKALRYVSSITLTLEKINTY
jgi:hypothetical protein